MSRLSACGGEVVLYRVAAGECCILTHAMVHGLGIAESDISAVGVPRRIFDRLFEESPQWRGFVLTTYASRMEQLVDLVEELAFSTSSHRLARRLLDLAEDGVIAATHQALAAEVGTAREVISRQLKCFERDGWIEIKRRRIRITNADALATLLDDESA